MISARTYLSSDIHPQKYNPLNILKLSRFQNIVEYSNININNAHQIVVLNRLKTRKTNYTTESSTEVKKNDTRMLCIAHTESIYK